MLRTKFIKMDFFQTYPLVLAQVENMFAKEMEMPIAISGGKN